MIRHFGFLAAPVTECAIRHRQGFRAWQRQAVRHSSLAVLRLGVHGFRVKFRAQRTQYPLSKEYTEYTLNYKGLILRFKVYSSFKGY